MIHPYLEFKESKIHRNGVFTQGDLKIGERIERSYYTVLDVELENLDSITKQYVFSYPKQGDKLSLVWGFGSIYNHSNHPNVDWYYDGDVIVWECIKNINKGEELTHNYKNTQRKR